MIALLFSLVMAHGADVYVNGTQVDSRSLVGNHFESVDIKVDGNGVLHITAPGYKVEVVGGGMTPFGQVAEETVAVQSATVPLVPDNGVARARWWLVTEDNASGGHVVEIHINGELTHTIRSGENQKILDVGSYLKLGDNSVVVRSESTNASGGTFYLYFGSGRDDAGTVVMDPPQIQFGIGASRAGAYERQFTLAVSP
jgi:hypothetical protein